MVHLRNNIRSILRQVSEIVFNHTNLAWELLLVVDIVLAPCHEMFNVFWCGHLRRALVIA